MAQTPQRLNYVATAAVVTASLLILCSDHSASADIFYLTGSSKTLSLTPQSGASHIDAWSSGSRTWSNLTDLNGDISGTNYEFHIFAASTGNANFQASILVNGVSVAQAPFTATSSIYSLKSGLVTGIDPVLTGTASLELRITHTGGNSVSILWGDTGGDTSYSRVPDPGDHNGDHKVDAADYVVWRKVDGTQAGYNTWRAHFGQTFSSTGSGSSATGFAESVPEPMTFLLASAALGLFFVPRRECLRCGKCVSSNRQ